MAQKIKFSFIKMFFRLFSFLADKTGGWKVFVQPKLLFGTMILGFGVAACNSAGKAKDDNGTAVVDTTETGVINDAMITCYEPAEATCYDMPAPPDTTKKEITKPKKKAKARKDTVYATPLYGAVRNDYIPLENDSNKIYTFVPVKAQFPGGDKQLMRWLEDNMIYPIVAQENGIQGKVYVNFIVRSDGRIDDVKIQKGVHQSLDNEAIRLIKAMPRWKAGENDKGEKVHSYFTLPVTFILKNE